MREVPQTYQQWMDYLNDISKKNVSAKEVMALKKGSCPGIETVSAQFYDKVQETVNAMLIRSTKQCTRMINESLEEGDFSNIEVILRRKNRELHLCRFYLNIGFIHSDYKNALDKNVVSEIERYWNTLRDNFLELSEESGNTQLLDITYYMRRLKIKDKLWETII